MGLCARRSIHVPQRFQHGARGVLDAIDLDGAFVRGHPHPAQGERPVAGGEHVLGPVLQLKDEAAAEENALAVGIDPLFVAEFVRQPVCLDDALKEDAGPAAAGEEAADLVGIRYPRLIWGHP